MRRLLSFLLSFLPDYLFTFLAFLARQRQWPNFKSPKTLNEKLAYIKIERLSPELRCMVADRLKVRDYVALNAPDCDLIRNLWVGADFDESVWSVLPDKFVIKANHGSGMVEIVDKKSSTYTDVNRIVTPWLDEDYAKKGREWFYAYSTRCLIVEEFVEFEKGVPPDYKFFCINGRVELVQVDLDRFGNHLRNLYDRNFSKLDVSLHYPKGYDIQQPKEYSMALNVAEALSACFDFIRVDLYLVEGRVLFGELTNIPGNALERFHPRLLDYQLGSKLKLVLK